MWAAVLRPRGFFGAAAYATGIVMKLLGATPELGLLAGALTGGLLGLAFGAIAIRRQGIYFAMITLALSQLVYFIAVQAGFTGGEACKACRAASCSGSGTWTASCPCTTSRWPCSRCYAFVLGC